MDNTGEVELNPIQITFSHGDVIPDKTRELICEALSDIRKRNKIRKVVIADGHNNVFCGKPDQSSLANQYLALRNKMTNKVRLYQLNNFLMLPHSPNQEKEVFSKACDNETKREAMLNLNKTMGSKRTKRRLMEAEKINIKLDNIEKTVETAIKNKSLVVEPIPNVSCSGGNYLPPCDRNAATVEEIYKVYDLISLDVLDSLDALSLEVLQNKVTASSNDGRLSLFFFNAYSKLKSIDTTKIKLLVFVDVLLKFLKEPMKTIRLQDPKLCKFSSPLNKELLNNFCIIGLGGLRNRPPSMRDKAICYVLVCLFLAFNFILNMDLLSGTLSPSEYNKLPLLMRAVGATRNRSQATSFQLKLPLAELPTSTGQRKGNYRKKT